MIITVAIFVIFSIFLLLFPRRASKTSISLNLSTVKIHTAEKLLPVKKMEEVEEYTHRFIDKGSRFEIERYFNIVFAKKSLVLDVYFIDEKEEEKMIIVKGFSIIFKAKINYKDVTTTIELYDKTDLIAHITFKSYTEDDIKDLMEITRKHLC